MVLAGSLDFASPIRYFTQTVVKGSSAYRFVRCACVGILVRLLMQVWSGFWSVCLAFLIFDLARRVWWREIVEVFRWGILGTGVVARKFVWGLRASVAAKAVVVASRSLEKANSFAKALDITRAYGSYEESLRDAAVDAFYVATPPSLHRDHALLCLNAGKPVLVEKPFTVNAGQAREIMETARTRSVFCMEAMWTRFLPVVRRLKTMIDEGAIGNVRMLSGSLGMAEAVNRDNPLFNAELGGGALLDRGVYPISLAFHLMGAPEGITGDAIIGETGVDEEAGAIFRYPKSGLGVFAASLRTQCANELMIMGTSGQIRLHAPIFRPFRMTVTPLRRREYTAPLSPSGSEAFKESHWVHNAIQRLSGVASGLRNRGAKSYSDRYSGNGYHYQADEVMHCVRSGRLESPIMPLSQSVSVMEAMDAIRSQWETCGKPLNRRGDVS